MKKLRRDIQTLITIIVRCWLLHDCTKKIILGLGFDYEVQKVHFDRIYQFVYRRQYDGKRDTGGVKDMDVLYVLYTMELSDMVELLKSTNFSCVKTLGKEVFDMHNCFDINLYYTYVKYCTCCGPKDSTYEINTDGFDRFVADMESCKTDMFTRYKPSFVERITHYFKKFITRMGLISNVLCSILIVDEVMKQKVKWMKENPIHMSAIVTQLAYHEVYMDYFIHL